jgi:modification methylase
MPLDEAVLQATPSKRGEARVAFLSLVEGGLIKPGDIVFDEKRRHTARVQADGTLALGAIVGSIHKIGALVQGLPACNGWTYWHRLDGKTIEPIDAVRARFRNGLATAEGIQSVAPAV